jgi:ferredoxin
MAMSRAAAAGELATGPAAVDRSGRVDATIRKNNTYVRTDGSKSSSRPGRFRVTLDPTVCDGHGLCAALFPEGIALDDWGYPLILEAGMAPADEVHARRAVSACPALALRLVREVDRTRT